MPVDLFVVFYFHPCVKVKSCSPQGIWRVCQVCQELNDSMYCVQKFCETRSVSLTWSVRLQMCRMHEMSCRMKVVNNAHKCKLNKLLQKSYTCNQTKITFRLYSTLDLRCSKTSQAILCSGGITCDPDKVL